MGISIHYKGKIKDTTFIPSLVDEVKDICGTMQWNHYVFDDELGKGICFSPAKCEPVMFAFSATGDLCSPLLLQHDINNEYISVKTHYAGVQAHIAIIKLTKYLEATYLKEFTLYDEGEYWETGDEKILQSQFDECNRMIDAVATALEKSEIAPGATAVSIADRIEQILKERFKDNDNFG